jgi:hypothetical protein
MFYASSNTNLCVQENGFALVQSVKEGIKDGEK